MGRPYQQPSTRFFTDGESRDARRSGAVEEGPPWKTYLLGLLGADIKECPSTEGEGDLGAGGGMEACFSPSSEKGEGG